MFYIGELKSLYSKPTMKRILESSLKWDRYE